jgi:hypothetical protein
MKEIKQVIPAIAVTKEDRLNVFLDWNSRWNS